MKNGRIILKARLDLQSPLLIGNGKGNSCDRDVLLDADGNAFIPATSFLGVISRKFEATTARKFLGQETDQHNQPINQSFLICDDLMPVEQSTACSIRDGIRINKATGLVENGAKFDFQVVEPGVCFALNMEFVVKSQQRYDEALQILANCLSVLNKPLYIGGKTSSGFGCLISKEAQVYQNDFDWKSDMAAYLLRKPTKDITASIETVDASSPEFSITADFRIPQSLIVRSYPKDAFGSDAAHIQSASGPVLPGTSLRGALRARAERILGILWPSGNADIEDFIASIFGFASTSGKHFSIPSSLRISETKIESVGSEVQNRIRIDRFTGGTIEGAKFDSMPVFPEDKNASNLRALNLSLADPLPSQKAMLLLLLKDIYTGDLPVGGEKGIGRGILEGVRATIFDENSSYSFEQFGQTDIPEVYREYLTALRENKDKVEIQKRLAVFKQKGAK